MDVQDFTEISRCTERLTLNLEPKYSYTEMNVFPCFSWQVLMVSGVFRAVVSDFPELKLGHLASKIICLGELSASILVVFTDFQRRVWKNASDCKLFVLVKVTSIFQSLYVQLHCLLEAVFLRFDFNTVNTSFRTVKYGRTRLLSLCG